MEPSLEHILRQSSNLSPYIFMLVQKVKHKIYKIHAFINVAILCRVCKLFHLKMMCTSCKDQVRVKVPSFQKVTIFSTIENIQKRLYQVTFLFV